MCFTTLAFQASPFANSGIAPLKLLAEKVGFAPTRALRPYLVSNEAQSAGLCDFSINSEEEGLEPPKAINPNRFQGGPTANYHIPPQIEISDEAGLAPTRDFHHTRFRGETFSI